MRPHYITMRSHNDLSPLYTILGGHHIFPPQVNIELGFPYGFEALKQAHKSHHKTHESPMEIQGGFHQTKRIIWF
jgi:hypothetical protein